MYWFNSERSITGRNFPFFFGTRNNRGGGGGGGGGTWEFLALVPFPLPVSGEVLKSLLAVMGKKIDSDLLELMKEGE